MRERRIFLRCPVAAFLTRTPYTISANGRMFIMSVPASGVSRSFPKIRSGRIGDVAQPVRELRRRYQSVESAVRAGNLYSKLDGCAYDCSTRHRPKEFAVGVPHRR